MNNDVYIPERFKKAIYLHIAKNNITSFIEQSPLILGIHGPTGEGKTFQCRFVLREMGIKPASISGGELESDHAGRPAEIISDRYIAASRLSEMNLPPVLLINDLDTSIGNWGNMVQYTMNPQLIYAELMAISDAPSVVRNHKTKRASIIITGNDFTKLYKPLARAGRMTLFSWQPSLDEKANIISRLFSSLSVPECTKLIENLEERIKCTGTIEGIIQFIRFRFLR